MFLQDLPTPAMEEISPYDNKTVLQWYSLEQLREYASTCRKPLTKEQLLQLLITVDPLTARLPRGMLEFARAIERAHGI